jgi:pimeloyl-ACP methyl ester carboxylesterase
MERRLHLESKGSGPAVLFIHAGVADSRMWDAQFRDLEGRRLIRFDMRGYGRSDLGSEEYTNRDDALSVLDQLEIDDVVLVGCSIGANTALQVCQTAPDRIRGLVLVGADAPGFDPGVDYQSPEWPQVVEAFKAGDLERVARLEGEIWLAGIDRSLSDLDPSLGELFMDMDLIALENEERREDLEKGTLETLPEVAAPVLAMVGKRDLPQLRAAAGHLAAVLADGEPIEIEDSAHLPSMDQPARFNQHLDSFLSHI